MAEEILRRRLADAFDPGPDFPDSRLLSRTMAALQTADRTRLRRRFAMRAVLNRQLVAAALIVLLLLAAAGAFLALQHFASTPTTVWGGCGGEFQCATVKVPIDYTHPTAGSIDISVARKPALDRSLRIGTLLILPGGSVSAIDYLRQNSSLYRALNARFDLAAFDQRGIGRSAPIRCLSDAQIDSLNEVDTVLDDAREKQVFINAYHAVAELCLQDAPRLLPYMDTGSVAQDVEAIRQALGEQKLTFLTFGTGTYLGQVYVLLHPTHVRAMALDGVVDMTRPASDLWARRAAGLEASLQAFLADCRSFVGCALAQGGNPAARLAQVLQAADRHPLVVGGRTLGRRNVIEALIYGLDPRAWRQLDAALNNAAGGDGTALLDLTDLGDGRRSDGTYSTFPEAATAQGCLDNPTSPNVADYDQLGAAMLQASPTFGPAFQYLPLVCAAWPSRAIRIPGPHSGEGAPPLLMVGATHDSLYPYADAEAVTARFPSSVLLTRDGFGYLSYFNSLCVRLEVNGYLEQRLTPSTLGKTCESDYPA